VPRISQEAKSAALFRAGSVRRPPPRRLCAAAKTLWREIVEDRPADYFRPGSFEALEQYCALTIEQRRAIRALKGASPNNDDYAAKLKAAKDLTTILATLARQLRLSVQAVTRGDAGKMSEKGAGAADRLLGGKAIWGEGVRPQ
jgi:hypothetical protein